MTDQVPEPPKPPKQPVLWGQVMFGIVLAWMVGFFALPLSFLLALALGGGPAGILAFLLPVGAVWLLWRVKSLQNPGVGRGVLIGGAIVVLLAGLCGLQALSGFK